MKDREKRKEISRIIGGVGTKEEEEEEDGRREEERIEEGAGFDQGREERQGTDKGNTVPAEGFKTKTFYSILQSIKVNVDCSFFIDSKSPRI